jgi:hypothetical protein
LFERFESLDLWLYLGYFVDQCINLRFARAAGTAAPAQLNGSHGISQDFVWLQRYKTPRYASRGVLHDTLTYRLN